MAWSKLKQVSLEAGISIVFMALLGAVAWSTLTDTNARFEFAGLHAHDQLGWEVAVPGDTDGDGYDDYLMAAPYATNRLHFTGESDGYYSGYTLLYSGKNGKRLRAIWGEPNEMMGKAITGLNDLDQDGWPEIAVASREKVSIFTKTQSFEIEGENLAAFEFGRDLARAGDVNGDGKEDLLVGSDAYPMGRVHLLSGSLIAQGQNSQIALIEGNQLYGPITGAGDLNRDGFADIALAAPALQKIYVYYGRSTGLNPTPTTISQAAFSDAVVSPAGDLNRDGFADLAVSSPYANGVAGMHAGRVFFYAGSASGIGQTPFAQLDGTIPLAFLGTSLAPAGDSNCDGRNEILIGAPGRAEGFVHLYNFNPSTSSFGLIRTFASGIVGESFGSAISARIKPAFGSVQTKIIIGAYMASPPVPFISSNSYAGKAYVYELSCRRLFGPLDPGID